MQTRFLLFLSVALFASAASASFTENSRRYLSPKDIFTVWTQKFPILADSAKASQLNSACWMIGDGNSNVTGAVNPAVGKASVDTPPPGFVRWLGSCAHDIVMAQFQDLKAQTTRRSKLYGKYWPKEALDKLDGKWSDLNPVVQTSIVRYAIEEMIGPEPVIKDLGFVKNMDELVKVVQAAATSDASLSVWDATAQIYLALSLREEFLTY